MGLLWVYERQRDCSTSEFPHNFTTRPTSQSLIRYGADVFGDEMDRSVRESEMHTADMSTSSSKVGAPVVRGNTVELLIVRRSYGGHDIELGLASKPDRRSVGRRRGDRLTGRDIGRVGSRPVGEDVIVRNCGRIEISFQSFTTSNRL